MQEKSEFLDAAKHLLTNELGSHGLHWKLFHSDSDSVMLSTEAIEWFDANLIAHSSSPADTPELNGHAEAVNKWLGAMTLSMLTPSGMTSAFWAHCYMVASRIKGYIPLETVRGWMAPDTFITGHKPNLHHERVWGCNCVVHEPRSASRKD